MNNTHYVILFNHLIEKHHLKFIVIVIENRRFVHSFFIINFIVLENVELKEINNLYLKKLLEIASKKTIVIINWSNDKDGEQRVIVRSIHSDYLHII